MNENWPWILAGLIALWLLIRRSPKKSKKGETVLTARKPPRSLDESFTWPSLGEFEFEVVGESHYQATLRENAGNHGKESASTECVAELIPNDGNEYDDKAVEVRIDGKLVGHLSRDDARSFRRRLRAKKLTGQTTFCHAQIVGGGTNRSGKSYSYGIRLDIKPFDRD
jgi:hypothetical protein